MTVSNKHLFALTLVIYLGMVWYFLFFSGLGVGIFFILKRSLFYPSARVVFFITKIQTIACLPPQTIENLLLKNKKLLEKKIA